MTSRHCVAILANGKRCGIEEPEMETTDDGVPLCQRHMAIHRNLGSVVLDTERERKRFLRSARLLGADVAKRDVAELIRHTIYAVIDERLRLEREYADLPDERPTQMLFDEADRSVNALADLILNGEHPDGKAGAVVDALRYNYFAQRKEDSHGD